MIRTKGEDGTGNVVAAVTHARIIDQEIKQLQNLDEEKLALAADSIISRYSVLADQSTLPGKYDMTPFGPIDTHMHSEVVQILSEIKEIQRLPVVTFSAGGIATADASLMMRIEWMVFS